MDIDKELSKFASKNDLLQYVKDLPDDSKGVMVFTYTQKVDLEDGEEPEDIEISSYKEYGEITPGEVLMLAHDLIDFARG